MLITPRLKAKWPVAATMVMEEQKRQSTRSGDWLIAVSLSQKKYVNWVVHPCSMWLHLSAVWNMQKWPQPIWTDGIIVTHYVGNGLTEGKLKGNCLRCRYKKSMTWVKNFFHYELFLLLKLEIFSCRDVLKYNMYVNCMGEIWGFLLWCLWQEVFLAEVILAEFHCS
jgi:hypothetical protein